MKRQFYLDDVERDLIRCALALWKHRLSPAVENASNGHHYAKYFTLRRIEELEKRLKEPAAAGPEGK